MNNLKSSFASTDDWSKTFQQEKSTLEKETYTLSPPALTESLLKTNVSFPEAVPSVHNSPVVEGFSAPSNSFPLAWTCYQKDGQTICPLRGNTP